MSFVNFRRALLAAFILVVPVASRAADITVFAAASLSDSLKSVGDAWQKKTGHSAAFSFAASSALARPPFGGPPGRDGVALQEVARCKFARSLVLAPLEVEGLEQLAVLVLRAHDLDVEVQLGQAELGILARLG